MAFVLAATPAASGADAIQWQSGAYVMPAQAPADVAAKLRTVAPERSTELRRVVIQFTQPVDDVGRASLAANGVRLLSYLGSNAFFATVEPGRLNATAISQAGVAGVTEAQTAWKLHPMLLAGETPTWAKVGEDAVGHPVIGTHVLFHQDVDLVSAGLDAIERNSGRVVGLLESINGAVVELPQDLVAALAAEDVVLWVEPPLPPMGPCNDSNRARVGADIVHAAPYNLTGAGVTVMVYDGGTARSTHLDFQGRLYVRDASGTSYHPTHVAGTIGGAGIANAAYKGMAPGVTLQAYGLQQVGGLQEGFLYTDPCDMQADYSQAINTYGAMISNNSIGTNTANNGFPCDWEGNYGATDVLIDTIVRGDGSNPLFTSPYRIIWANGNERTGGGGRCGTTYHTTAPPACAKNHITVGALNSNDDSMTSFSSWGPADDGRMKPDISAPGCQSNGDLGVTSCDDDSDTDYTALCGTSMACPTVTGISALIIQDFQAQFPGQPLFRNSTLKCWLAHTAVDLGNTGPDYQYGYGSVRVQAAIDFMRTEQFVESSITQGATYTRTVNITAGDPELKVTLAWDDYPGTPSVNPALVNDLDLRVWSPTGTRYYPWTLGGLANPSAPAVQTQENHVDNIEQVRVNSPQAGTWTIEVYGYAVPQGPQPFSLVGDGAINVGTSIGFPGGLPTTMPPGTPTVIDVTVSSVGETTVPGSPTMYYRYSGGTFTSVGLTYLGGNNYQGTLPAASCADTPEFYFSAAGSVTGTVYSPPNAPTGFYSAEVGETVVLFQDNFETNLGWTVQNSTSPALTDGAWDRGVPVDCDRGDPPSDYDGSGQCYLTDNNATDCNSDVDGGYTWLMSPTIDLSSGDADVYYALWYSNDYGADPNNDYFRVYVSNNNGTNWTQVHVFGPSGPGGWGMHSFRVGDFLTPTSQVKVRFEASDLNSGSVVEAGVDAFRVERFECVSSDGACCFSNGSCSVETPGDCSGAGGSYQGNGTSCSPNPCPQPGACCFANGSCTETLQASCTGTWLGAGTDCTPNPCPQPGACCFANGSCTETLQASCTGTWLGAGTDCTPNPCPQPGACCFANGTCTETLQASCTGTWLGAGTDCTPNPCPQPGACCHPDGSCTVTLEASCADNWLGAGTTCSPNPCPQPGACCYADGSCAVTFAADCTGSWLGAGTNCTPNPCPQPGACCYADGSCAVTFAPDCTGSWLGAGTSCMPNPCPQPGACCHPDGSCTVTLQANCADNWLGAGTVCVPNPCEQPGACCYADGSCAVTFAADCTGSWLGAGTDCTPNPCPQPGACCHPDGSCTVTLQANCADNWLGAGTVCVPNPCEQPGACCYADGSCAVTFAADCTGSWLGAGTDCTPNPCPQPGACCYPDSSCVMTFELDCPGLWLGAGTTCVPNPCSTMWCMGDSNCSFGSPSFDDIKYFAVSLSGESAWWQYHRDQTGIDPTCPYLINDMNGAGGVEFGDIKPFAASIGQPCIPYVPPIP